MQIEDALADNRGDRQPQEVIQAILCAFDLHDSSGSDTFWEDLIDSLDSVKGQLSLEEISHGLFYASKLLTDPNKLKDIIVDTLERVRSLDNLELADLSRLIVALNSIRDLPIYYTYPILISRITHYLDKEELPYNELIYTTIALKPFLR